MATQYNAVEAEPKFQAPVVTDDAPERAVPLDYVPEGFETVEDFLKDALEQIQEDSDADKDNREAAMDDLTFTAKDQWDPEVRADRESRGKPCVTINVIPQFVGQVIGDRRMNKTSIMVRPKLDATMKMAEVRSGIIKSIEEFSRAERVYDAACEDQVTCGIGNFRINMDYADDEAFLQDIFIRGIPNPLSVIWDRMAQDPTGRDARRCTVIDGIPTKDYEKTWPDARPTNDFQMDSVLSRASWFENNTVRVAEFWQMKERPAVLAMMADGTTKNITGQNLNELIAAGAIALHPRTQKPVVRVGTCKYAVMHLITGWDILAGPYELPINRLPIIRVMGREVRVGDERIRFGLVRWAKDAQRMKNYWRSVAVEKLAMAPKNVWTAEAGAVEGREEAWRSAHASDDPLLIHNDGKTAPQRVDPPAVDAAILQEVAMNQQDIKDTTGLHDASLGIRSNEVSGKAIMARQQEGDVATVIFHDNLNAAIQEGGDVVNQLLPVAYDTVRMLRCVGKDGKEEIMRFNDPNDPNSIDLSVGRYDVSIQSGPSYTTQRMLAADAMLEAVKVFPQLMEIAGDLVVEAQDWPGAHGISERLKKAMPKELIGDDAEDLSPEEQAAAAQQQAAAMEEQQQAQQMQQRAVQLELATKEAQMLQAQADAKRAQAEAERAEAEAEKAEIEVEAMAALKAAEVLSIRHPDQSDNSSQRSGAPRSESRPPNGRQQRKPK